MRVVSCYSDVETSVSMSTVARPAPAQQTSQSWSLRQLSLVTGAANTTIGKKQKGKFLFL